MFDCPASSVIGELGVIVGVPSADFTVIVELYAEFAVVNGTDVPVSVTITFATTGLFPVVHCELVVNVNVFDAVIRFASMFPDTALKTSKLYEYVPVPPVSYAAIVFDWPASKVIGDDGVIVGVPSALSTVMDALLMEFAVVGVIVPVSVTITFAFNGLFVVHCEFVVNVNEFDDVIMFASTTLLMLLNTMKLYE